MGEKTVVMNNVNILLDLSFVTNIRYLDQHELYLSDNIQLQNTLPFASGIAMARGILDSLMSATYFNASALRFLRLLVTSRDLCPVTGLTAFLNKVGPLRSWREVCLKERD